MRSDVVIEVIVAFFLFLRNGVYTLRMPISKNRILFQDQWLLAVNKLGGELVVKGKGAVQKLPLLDFLKEEYPALFPVHRLDYETSGIVVFAKNRAVLKTVIEEKFAGWIKTYEAIVLGHPRKKEDTISFSLTPRSGKGTVDAETKYRIIELLETCTFVELQFERGQRHQIRRHMAAIHHPLLFDDKYGDIRVNRKLSRPLKMNRFFLHASSISFPHPVTKETIKIACERPASFDRAIKKLKK